MYYIPLLYRLEYYLQKSSLVFKLLLFLVPLIILILFFNFYEMNKLKKNKFKEEIVVLQKKQSQVIDMINIMKKIEQFSHTHRIIVAKHKVQNRVIWLKLQVPKTAILSLIEFAQLFHAFSKIETIHIRNNQSWFDVEMKLDFTHYYDKPAYTIKKAKIVPKIEKKIEKKPYHLQAIISQYVLIDQHWYEHKSKLDEYTVFIKDANTTQLIKGNDIIVLKVYHETQ